MAVASSSPSCSPTCQAAMRPSRSTRLVAGTPFWMVSGPQPGPRTGNLELERTSPRLSHPVRRGRRRRGRRGRTDLRRYSGGPPTARRRDDHHDRDGDSQLVQALMAALALVGITGIYLRQLEETGVLGWVGDLLFALATSSCWDPVRLRACAPGMRRHEPRLRQRRHRRGPRYSGR